MILIQSEAKVYLRFLKIHFLSGLEYKGWWLMFIQVMVTALTDPIGIFLLFSRFGSIGVWSIERIILIYAIAITSFGLAESFCRGFDYFPWRMIRTGDFDRLLLRPCSLFTQVAGSYFHIHRLARVMSGVFVIAWSLSRQGISLSAFNLIVLLLALVGGCLTYSGVFVMTSGIAFFTINGLEWIYIFTNASYQVTRCPIDYMPNILRNTFTFFMPILVVSYYPAAIICGWSDNTYLALLALPTGLAFLFASLIVWRIGVRYYKSSGS